MTGDRVGIAARARRPAALAVAALAVLAVSVPAAAGGRSDLPGPAVATRPAVGMPAVSDPDVPRLAPAAMTTQPYPPPTIYRPAPGQPLRIPTLTPPRRTPPTGNRPTVTRPTVTRPTVTRPTVTRPTVTRPTRTVRPPTITVPTRVPPRFTPPPRTTTATIPRPTTSRPALVPVPRPFTAPPRPPTYPTPTYTPTPARRVTVPRVAGMGLYVAENVLRGRGLTIGAVDVEYGPGGSGVVLRTRPGEGAAVPAGSAINLVISWPG